LEKQTPRLQAPRFEAKKRQNMTRMHRIMNLTDATPEELLSEGRHHFLHNEIAL
jgi:hypothetical protein